MCSDRRQKYGCGQKNPEGTSSTRFGLRTAAKCGELKRCADRIRSRIYNKDEVLAVNLNLKFSPSTKTTTEYSLELFVPLIKLI